MYKVIFKGFKYPWQATEFVKWFEGEAEVSASNWCEENGKFTIGSVYPHDIEKIEGNTTVKLKIQDTF